MFAIKIQPFRNHTTHFTGGIDFIHHEKILFESTMAQPYCVHHQTNLCMVVSAKYVDVKMVHPPTVFFESPKIVLWLRTFYCSRRSCTDFQI